MSTPIKLQDTELLKLKEIQTKYQNKLYDFGQLYLEKLSLDEKFKILEENEKVAKSEFELIQKEEQQWMNDIASKYGDGNLSLKDGTFIPSIK